MTVVAVVVSTASSTNAAHSQSGTNYSSSVRSNLERGTPGFRMVSTNVMIGRIFVTPFQYLEVTFWGYDS